MSGVSSRRRRYLPPPILFSICPLDAFLLPDKMCDVSELTSGGIPEFHMAEVCSPVQLLRCVC
ncbi:unnamed protein product [Brassica rapa subsp. narinosa]